MDSPAGGVGGLVGRAFGDLKFEIGRVRRRAGEVRSEKCEVGMSSWVARVRSLEIPDLWGGK